jgi:hypothetical protein
MIRMEDKIAFSEKNNEPKKPLTFDTYQVKADLTAIYTLTNAVKYPALGLAGEAGEIANKMKKTIRDKTFQKDDIAKEMGDCI